jgi:hypothetical protein
VTDFTVTEANAYKIMRGGRSRWKIESETYNTLKDQGYHFEHNYGLGKINLCLVFVMLMMLAFLVDQTQQLSCNLLYIKNYLKLLKMSGNCWAIIKSLLGEITPESA